jgi:hypothetical protein
MINIKKTLTEKDSIEKNKAECKAEIKTIAIAAEPAATMVEYLLSIKMVRKIEKIKPAPEKFSPEKKQLRKKENRNTTEEYIRACLELIFTIELRS